MEMGKIIEQSLREEKMTKTVFLNRNEQEIDKFRKERDLVVKKVVELMVQKYELGCLM